MLTKETQAGTETIMETHPYDAGRDEMREQMLAFIYERYCYFKKWHGRDSIVCEALKGIILDVRESQAIEQEKTQTHDIE
jgi:hypothetical protein